MNNIKTIAYYTFKEVIQSRILLNTFIIGLIMALSTFVAFSFTYGDAARIALDFGLGGLSLSAVGIAIFMGAGLLSKEIDSRTIYMIISRPVSRSSFVLGKAFGLFGVLIINTALLTLMTLCCYFLAGGNYSELILWSVVFTLFEALLALSIVMTLSLVTTQTMSIMLGLIIYVSGHAISGAKIVLYTKQFPALEKILDFYHYVLPGFYKFNIKEFVLYKDSLDLNYILSSLSYGVIYVTFLLLVSIFAFNNKDLS